MLATRPIDYPIQHVVIYKGHENHPLRGPYSDSVEKRIALLEAYNQQRISLTKNEWKLSMVSGENLLSTLKQHNPKETLLVIPPGQSTRLDQVFTLAQTTFLKDDFFCKGGRGYFTCGSAYWVSEKRIYKDLCEEQPENAKTIVKMSHLPLFHGIAEGPLCPFPGKKYKVGFYSDAIKIKGFDQECTIFLGGGGCFIPYSNDRKQKINVLARYLPSELQRHGKKLEECETWEKAAILVSVGQGAALLSMFHPYYGKDDIDVEAYEETFPDCGTNWREIKQKLSPFPERLEFFGHLMNSLERKDF